MNAYPKINIVTPSFNQGKFLEETIQSILNQNYQNLEYFVVDGGSTDNSVDIIKKYANRINWWVSEPDKGQSDAINKSFQKTKGDWLCWVNSDDILLPRALGKVAETFNLNPSADVITGNVLYINQNNIITRCVKVPKVSWFFYRHSVGSFVAPAVFFKRSLYEKVGGLDIKLHYSMDLDLWHKFRLAGAKIYHIREYLGGFRIHQSSKTGPRMLGTKKYFEHPETTQIRKKYIPGVQKNTIRVFRVLYKLRQLANFNYLRGWIDLQKWKGKRWKEI
jgi:glycosyltransferase involved in cell wall biosynthesis